VLLESTVRAHLTTLYEVLCVLEGAWSCL